MKGRVIKSTGSWYTVLNKNNETVQCRMAGKFRLKGIKSTNPIAVGDFVEYRLENDQRGVISKIENRKNYIIRKSVNLSKQVQIIASNIDQAMLVVSLKAPSTPLGFIDRFLVTAEAYSIPTILVFNKIDLLDDKKELDEIEAVYRDIGYTTLRTSAVTSQNIDVLKNLLKNKSTLLSGHSGVGKSTLINLVEDGLNLRTQEVSESHNKGQHTTTFAEMFPLKNGGFIIDTPGIKGFGLVDMKPEELQDYFPEIFALRGGCKFYNCMHQNEPGCAVKEALENDKLAPSRYNNYINLILGNEDDSPYRKDIYV